MTSTSSARTARSDGPLVAAELATAAVVGLVGWLLFALSEDTPDRAVGACLLAAAVLSAVLGGALLAGTGGAHRWVLPVSGVVVALGVAAAAVLLTGDGAFVSDALLAGAPPVVGGVGTALLARRSRRP